MSKLVSDISDGQFEAEVVQSDVPVLVDFWASWCTPCKAIAPIIDELAMEYAGKVKFVKVNVDENREYAGRFNVRSIPNLILFKNGELQDQIVGLVAKQELAAALTKVL